MVEKVSGKKKKKIGRKKLKEKSSTLTDLEVKPTKSQQKRKHHSLN
jgi:hypothetical protein